MSNYGCKFQPGERSHVLITDDCSLNYTKFSAPGDCRIVVCHGFKDNHGTVTAREDESGNPGFVVLCGKGQGSQAANYCHFANSAVMLPRGSNYSKFVDCVGNFGSDGGVTFKGERDEDDIQTFLDNHTTAPRGVKAEKWIKFCQGRPFHGLLSSPLTKEESATQTEPIDDVPSSQDTQSNADLFATVLERCSLEELDQFIQQARIKQATSNLARLEVDATAVTLSSSDHSSEPDTLTAGSDDDEYDLIDFGVTKETDK